MTDKGFRIAELIEKVRSLTAARWDNERIVQCLFDAGLSKGDAIQVLSRGGGVPHPDAFLIVHHSKAYEARRAVDEAWNNALWDCLENDEFIASLESGRDETTEGPPPGEIQSSGGPMNEGRS